MSEKKLPQWGHNSAWNFTMVCALRNSRSRQLTAAHLHQCIKRHNNPVNKVLSFSDFYVVVTEFLLNSLSERKPNT